MTTIAFWAVRHKPTGYYLPEINSKLNRGGSYAEPVPAREKRPRFFASERGAKIYLTVWLKGQVAHSYGYDSFTGDSWEDIGIIPVPGRDRAEMEIVGWSIEV